MTRYTIIAILLLSTQSAWAQNSDLSELAQFVKVYEETWNTHDAQLLAGLFTEDSDMLVGIGPRLSGRSAVGRWWEIYFSRIDRGRFLEISIDSVRFLGSDVALLNVDTTTGGEHAETSEMLPTRLARGTWVVVRRHGDWQISALRAHSPLGESREGPGVDQ